jgi:hypothetical protein
MRDLRQTHTRVHFQLYTISRRAGAGAERVSVALLEKLGGRQRELLTEWYEGRGECQPSVGTAEVKDGRHRTGRDRDIAPITSAGY